LKQISAKLAEHTWCATKTRKFAETKKLSSPNLMY